MTRSVQIRWTALITLMIGLVLAVASGWFDREAIGARHEAHAHSAVAVSSRLFAVATVFILLTALEVQHSKTTARLRELEAELAALKTGQARA